MLSVFTVKEIPDDNGNPFLNLLALLRIRTRASLLATAIETVGVYGWDPCGRMRHYPGDSDGARTALGLLEQARTVYLREGHYESDELDDKGLDSFGWAASASPAFERIDALSADGAAEAFSGRNPRAMIFIVGALLRFIEGRLPGAPRPHPDFKDRTDLADKLDLDLKKSLVGLSADNLNTLFTEVNRLTDEGVVKGRAKKKRG